MSRKYSQIIDELEEAISKIQSQGISIEPLNKAVEELKAHSENIAIIEKNIDAVKSEVIVPIKDELEQNKKAGKFSIWGFYIGAFGLCATALSLLYTSFWSESSSTRYIQVDSSETKVVITNPNEYLKSINDNLKEINYSINGLNDDYSAQSDELILKSLDDEHLLLESDSNIITVDAYVTNEYEYGEKIYPFVKLSFYINGRQVGTQGLKEKVKIINKSGVSHIKDDWSSIMMTENDYFVILDEFKYEIVRIFRKESQILTVADSENQVLIKRIR